MLKNTASIAMINMSTATVSTCVDANGATDHYAHSSGSVAVGGGGGCYTSSRISLEKCWSPKKVAQTSGHLSPHNVSGYTSRQPTPQKHV